MNAFVETTSNFIQNTHCAALLLDVWLKSFVVLALAGGVCCLWRRFSAATRHLIRFLALLSLPFLPLFASVLPSWHRPLWSVSSSLVSGNEVSLTLELAPLSHTIPGAPQVEPVRADASNASGHQAGNGQLVAARFNKSWLALAFLAWSGGIGLTLLYWFGGQIQLRSISRRARVVGDTGWALSLREARETLRIRQPVVLLQSADDVMPLTWGWFRPVVLVPAEADQWPADRRRVVLLHELAHVKRRDCLTQFIARIVCALFWFNPLVWLAARRMCVERERACDDLVLNGGCKASDYANHLVEIAWKFRQVPHATAIAMARSSGLEKRIVAIVDASRARRLGAVTMWTILIMIGGLIVCVGGSGASGTPIGTNNSMSLEEQQIARLKAFSVSKLKQSQTLAASAGEKISPEFQRFFAAATSGDWQTVTNMYESFKQRHPQYERTPGIPQDPGLRTSYWGPVLEITMAYEHVIRCEPKYTQMAVDDMISSIPAGSIYFGGTDPGRALPTAFCKSHVDADPFFTLTQNALADGTYLKYLRDMYGARIYTPTDADSQKAFQEYMADAGRRLEENKLKPGEQVKRAENGSIQISGQVAVMSINALITKTIFDKNPDREFYVEESFPLDWMYPHLEPHGLIMKINRQPLPELSDELVRQDREFWSSRVAGMVGSWLTEETPVKTVTDFAEKTYERKDLSGFKGDPQFVQNAYAQRCFSKWRSSIGGVYAWRAEHAANESEKSRMAREADLAFRQAFVLCPDSPEAVFRYVTSLTREKRNSDALLIAETASHLNQKNDQLKDLVKRLKENGPAM